MSDSSAYFYVDWTSEKTVAWPKTCKQSDMTTPCSAAPLLMQCSYNQKNTSFAIVDTIELSGYTINQYFTQKDLVCLGSNCIQTDVIGATVVDSDVYHYDQDSAYGILGLGPNSNLWRAFIDTDTKQSTYSISLAAPVNAITTVTLGASVPTTYQSQASLISTGNSDTTFVSSLAFGTVYTQNGVDTSEYFVNYTQSQNLIQFNTNVQGMLMTNGQLEWFKLYLLNLTNFTSTQNGLLLNTTCQSTPVT